MVLTLNFSVLIKRSNFNDNLTINIREEKQPYGNRNISNQCHF